MNEAALFAARGSKRLVDMDDFERAKDKVIMGAERRSMVMPEEERRNTAYHESGHAIVARLLPKTDPVHKVTIIPRGRALGVTMQLPVEDRYSYDRTFLLNNIAVMFGGRIAQVASPKEIYQRPVNRQVADFLGGMNFVNAEIVEENGAEMVLETSGFGRVKADKPAAFVRSGNGATLGIRPERLRVLWDDARSQNEIAGTVVDRHYFGEITHLIVEIPGLEKPLSVTETNDFGADDIPVGTAIRLAYDPEALVAMAD